MVGDSLTPWVTPNDRPGFNVVIAAPKNIGLRDEAGRMLRGMRRLRRVRAA